MRNYCLRAVREHYDISCFNTTIIVQHTREHHDQPVEDPNVEVRDEAFAASARFRFVTELNWKRKLALVLWVVCSLGLLLPTNFLHESPGLGLAVSTVPLLLIWFGDWLADDDATDVSVGPMLTGAFGNVLMLRHTARMPIISSSSLSTWRLV
jgi:hypothetical protein